MMNEALEFPIRSRWCCRLDKQTPGYARSESVGPQEARRSRSNPERQTPRLRDSTARGQNRCRDDS